MYASISSDGTNFTTITRGLGVRVESLIECCATDKLGNVLISANYLGSNHSYSADFGQNWNEITPVGLSSGTTTADARCVGYGNSKFFSGFVGGYAAISPPLI